MMFQFTRRLLSLVLVTILLLTSGISTASDAQPTPSATLAMDGNIRLYVGHGAQLTAEMPASWTPDYSLDYHYAGRTGFIASAPLTPFDTSLDSLDDACALVAAAEPYNDDSRVESTTWREMPACVTRTADEDANDPVSLVVAHPDPAGIGHNEYVAVTVDAAHFNEIVATISFDEDEVTPEDWLDAAIDLIEPHTLYRNSIDWDQVRQDARARIVDLDTGQQMWSVYPSVEYVLEHIRLAGGDFHNLFRSAGETATFSATYYEGPAPYVDPVGLQRSSGIGYMAIPAFVGDDEQAVRFVSEIQDIIADGVDADNCGWIVDLRGNTGGSMSPMIGGLAPLLQPGWLLGLQNVNGDQIDVTFNHDGTFSYAGKPAGWLPQGPAPGDAELHEQAVAVLIGPRTSSSGEATALAFANRDHTRFFGETSAGMATGTVYFYLFDGSMLSLAAWWMTGPQGAIYPDGVLPDEVVSPSDVVQPLDADPVIEAASDWLAQQSGCGDTTATPVVTPADNHEANDP